MKITVHYRGRADFPVVGTLADDARGRIFFEFDPDWRAGGLELSPSVLGAIRQWPSFAEQAGLRDREAALLQDEFPAGRW